MDYTVNHSAVSHMIYTFKNMYIWWEHIVPRKFIAVKQKSKLLTKRLIFLLTCHWYPHCWHQSQISILNGILENLKSCAYIIYYFWSSKNEMNNWIYNKKWISIKTFHIFQNQLDGVEIFRRWKPDTTVEIYEIHRQCFSHGLIWHLNMKVYEESTWTRHLTLNSTNSRANNSKWDYLLTTQNQAPDI